MIDSKKDKIGYYFGIKYSLKKHKWSKIVMPILTIVLFFVSVAFFIIMQKSISSLYRYISISLDLYTMALISVLSIVVCFDECMMVERDAYFYTYCFSVFLGSFSNALNIAFESSAKWDVLCKIAMYTNYLALPFVCLSFYYYQDGLYNRQFKGRKYLLHLVTTLFVVDVIYIILSGVTDKYIFVIENSKYINERYVFSFFVYPAIVLSCFFFAYNRDEVKMKKRIIGSCFFLILPMVMIILWYITGIQMIYIGCSITAVVVYGLMHLERSLEITKKDKELMEKKQELMLSQINPHFLYNTLSTIKVLYESDSKLAADTIDEFSRYLRVNIDSLNRVGGVPFEKELKHVKTYLNIELLRFTDLKVEYDIKETEFCLPVLTVQPIVENAVRYGARTNKNEEGLIRISTYKEGGWYIVEVYDNGNGFNEEEILNNLDDDRVHCGISNVRERLKDVSNGKLEIYSIIGEGTSVKIKIPSEVKHERNLHR